MSSARFDDILRGKLEAARHDGAPDWEGLRGLLDGEAFDAALSSGLSAPPPVGTSAAGATAALPDWDSLSAKLDADADASGEAFDALIGRRVARATSDVEPSASWRQLSHRIDTLWPLRRRLARYRALEVAAVILLLLTFLPLLRNHFDGPAGEREAVLAKAQKPVDAPRAGETTDVTAARAPNVLADGAPEAAVRPGTPYSPVDNLLGALGLHDVGAAVRTPAEIAALYAPAVERVRGTDPGALTSELQTDGATSIPAHPSPGIIPAPVISQRSGLPTASFLPTGVLAALPDAAPAPGLLLPVSAAVADNPWSFGAGGARKTWRIYTPTDAAFAREGSVQMVTATQLGAHVLRDLGARWRIGASLATASASYETGLPEVRRIAIVTQAGYDVKEDFRGIDLEVAQAVADVRFALLPQQRGLQVWAKAGVGANAFLRTAYDLYREEIAAKPPPPSLSGLEEFGSKPTVSRGYVPTEGKIFNDGLLQGGSLTDNMRPFGRVGLEAELELGDRLRVFGGVDYDLALPGQAGFGPNRDQFGGYDIGFGARISL